MLNSKISKLKENHKELTLLQKSEELYFLFYLFKKINKISNIDKLEEKDFIFFCKNSGIPHESELFFIKNRKELSSILETREISKILQAKKFSYNNDSLLSLSDYQVGFMKKALFNVVEQLPEIERYKLVQKFMNLYARNAYIEILGELINKKIKLHPKATVERILKNNSQIKKVFTTKQLKDLEKISFSILLSEKMNQKLINIDKYDIMSPTINNDLTIFLKENIFSKKININELIEPNNWLSFIQKQKFFVSLLNKEKKYLLNALDEFVVKKELDVSPLLEVEGKQQKKQTKEAKMIALITVALNEIDIYNKFGKFSNNLNLNELNLILNKLKIDFDEKTTHSNLLNIALEEMAYRNFSNIAKTFDSIKGDISESQLAILNENIKKHNINYNYKIIKLLVIKFYELNIMKIFNKNLDEISLMDMIKFFGADRKINSLPEGLGIIFGKLSDTIITKYISENLKDEEYFVHNKIAENILLRKLNSNSKKEK